MSRKRRMFDVEMPEDGAGETFPAGKVEESGPAPAPRRGPMATAITEAASSSRERREVEARIRAENDALAHEHVRLKKLGLIVDLVPLDRVEAYKLTRDRAPGPDRELAELKQSIREIGLSNPIRVEAREDGRYELIQGYRRLTAYREIVAEAEAEESGEDAEPFRTIPAAVSQPGESLDSLYRRMVDENMVRKDVSFAEMAQLAVDYAADPDIALTDPDKAVAALFKSAGYQKRSYIRSFIRLVEGLGDALCFPAEIPRALGVALVAQMERDGEVVPAIRRELAQMDNRSVPQELAVLRRFACLDGEPGGQAGGAEGQGARAAGRATPRPAQARTSFQIGRRQGVAKCTAAQGRLEVRLDRDFSTIDRRRLEQAVQQMLDRLDD